MTQVQIAVAPDGSALLRLTPGQAEKLARAIGECDHIPEDCSELTSAVRKALLGKSAANDALIETDKCTRCTWRGSWDGAVCPECGADTKGIAIEFETETEVRQIVEVDANAGLVSVLIYTKSEGGGCAWLKPSEAIRLRDAIDAKLAQLDVMKP